MKALVTGASGFIGSTLIAELNTLGFEVFALLRKSSSSANLKSVRFTRVDGDIRDLDALKRAVTGMDYIFHLAGVVAAPDRDGYFEHNARGTGRLADAAVLACPGLQRFVYVSSLAAGGPASSRENPRTEQDADAPVSTYGQSKLEGERLLLQHRDRIPVVILRPPLVYGPRDKGVFTLIQTVDRHLMPLLRGRTPDGSKYYSQIHVKDLCRGITQAALAPASKVPSGEIFYLSADDIVSYEEMLSTMATRLGRNPVKIRIPELAVRGLAEVAHAAGKMLGRTLPLNRDKLNELLPDFWTCSNAKARQVLGFAPEFDLSRGMADAIDWYKRQGWL